MSISGLEVSVIPISGLCAVKQGGAFCAELSCSDQRCEKQAARGPGTVRTSPTVKRVREELFSAQTFLPRSDGRSRNTTMRNITVLKGHTWAETLRLSNLSVLYPGESRGFCAEDHTIRHTFRTLRGARASHPRVSSSLSPGSSLC